MMVKSPIRWLGGKGRPQIMNQLLPLVPPHETYVEPFAGGAALFFAKPPAPFEVLNDLDGRLVNFYRVLRDPDQYRELIRLLELTPYSRGEYRACVAMMKDPTAWGAASPLEKARVFFAVATMSFGGTLGGGWSNVHELQAGIPTYVAKYLAKLRLLPEVHARLRRAQIDNRPWDYVACKYDSPDTFMYLDPPYLDTCQEYAHSMDHEAHETMIRIIKGMRGKVMLSGYVNDLYRDLEGAGWQRIDLKGILCNITQEPRQEAVWINYDPPVHQPGLFDGLAD